MSPHRITILVCTVLGLASLGCEKAETTTPEDASHQTHGDHEGDAHGDHEGDEYAGREVVDNWEAETGDVTVCPISGKKFEVDDSSGHFDYQGYSFVFCCSGGCIDKVAADPGKYLDALVERAGGPGGDAAPPSADPDQGAGGAIDDGPDQG